MDRPQKLDEALDVILDYCPEATQLTSLALGQLAVDLSMHLDRGGVAWQWLVLKHPGYQGLKNRAEELINMQFAFGTEK